MITPVPVGPFRLLHLIGRGGMGCVFRAEVLAGGHPVAIKVLTAERARQPDQVLAFQREVRAVARLRHPSIVRVFDHGQLPDAAAALAPDVLVAGSPYLVMELAECALVDRPPPSGFPGVRALLTPLLLALAHAHARDLVHRDVKPANILLRTDADAGTDLCLSDFGLAHALSAPEAAAGHGSQAGSPAYMAPEQFLGTQRDFGPWTDLYAVGCVAWELLTGRPPFSAETLPALAHLHLNAALPAPRFRMAVPAGLVDWLGRLLAKDPGDRFGRAASALDALLSLESEPADFVPIEGAASSSARCDAETLAGTADTFDAVTARPRAPAAAAGTSTRVARPPLPVPDRPPAPAETPATRSDGTPPGIGLGLYGLKELPLAGRDVERERLWAALHRVASTGEPWAVLLRGPAGFGKRRLVRWLADQAAELGVAERVTVRHEAIFSSGLEIEAALAGRLGGLAPGGVRALAAGLSRMAGSLDETDLDDVAALATCLSSASDTSPSPLPARARRAVLLRLLARLGAGGPTILVLEDLQWGPASLEIVAALLEGGAQAARAMPILVVATWTDDAEAPAGHNARLDALEREPRFERLAIGALPEDAWPVLVRGLLGLDGRLARALEERAAGCPLFAVETVAEWVRSGALEATGLGFRLRDGLEPPLPANLAGTWTRRVERALADRPAAWTRALEVAASLGLRFVGDEWSRACRSLDIDVVPATLLTHVAGQRLVEIHAEGGGEFVNPAIREVILAGAAMAGRQPRIDAACAAALAASDGAGPGRHERRGRHLAAAGDRLQARAPLRQGALERLERGDIRGAAMVLVERARLREVPSEPDDEDVQGWLQESRTAAAAGDFGRAVALAERARLGAADLGPTLSAEAIYRHGRALQLMGDLDRARNLLALAVDAAADSPLAAHAETDLGWAWLESGADDEAASCFERAHAAFAARGEVRAAALCLRSLAVVARRARRLDEGRARALSARALYETCGARAGVADCENTLGELARAAGELDAACAHYRAAHRQLTLLGSGNATVALANLGLAELEGGRPHAARLCFDEAAATARREGREAVEAAVGAFRLACEAELGAFADVERRLEDCLEGLRRTGYRDPDVRHCLNRAASRAREAGFTTLASRLDAD